MSKKIYALLDKAIDNLKAGGLFKPEFVVNSAQGREIKIGTKTYLNFSSDDFLGLANSDRIQRAAIKYVQEYGNGLASPRIITGTQKIHQEFEEDIAEFFKKDSAMIFTSQYDACLGLFESLFNEQDFIFCDTYAHPSLIDGIYKTPAQKLFYLRNILGDLEDQLKRSPRARFRVIVTEGVYAMDGQTAHLEEICKLAEEYDALVFLNDSLGVGVLGETGRGTAEFAKVLDKVDLITGGFSHGLSGIDLGYIAGNESIIDWLKQNSKPYSYSTSPAPMAVGAAQEALRAIPEMTEVRTRVIENSRVLRAKLGQSGYNVTKGPHPIISVITYEAVKTQKLMDSLLDEGIFAIGLCYPLVPKGFARVRLQLNVAHIDDDIRHVVSTFEKYGDKHKILKKGG